MKNIRIPLVAAMVLFLGFVALVNWTAPMFPERVASHFGPSGAPDSWVSKSNFLTFTLLFGLGLPLAVVVIFSLATSLPHRVINLPHKDYWLSPERQRETRFYLIAKGLWLSCLILLLMGVMHYLVIQAHQAEPVRLPMTGFAIALGAFLAGVGVWMFLFFRRFAKVGKA